MPPAALRCSLGPVPRGKTHRRGYSLDAGLQFREKDDDLALFNDLKERENFLLVSTDNFEAHSSANMRYFSDIKLGISIPVQGESSGLLNADGDKNDYDWLMTPPDTPLFASLDDEPAPANLVQRGRPRSQPISISRSSTMEKCNKSSRGSASPQRSSPSPGSSSSTLLSRGRPSSAPHSSPTSTLRHATSSRRPSPPPLKSLAPAPRSSSPTPRKMSTGSGRARVSSGVRGLSPTKARAGGSVSPKIRAWQSNIPGFSSDAPPNLRTSPADRPVSYVRVSSPASRHGRDSSSRIGRQAIASSTSRSASSSHSHDLPIASSTSRSASSSHSHDRDRFCTNSKGSVALSGDDDTDSLWSLPRGCSDGLSSRRASAFSRNRAPTFSKKPSRTCLSSSAPKRYVDSSHRQMDYQKSPQNMFRPLLSNVSSTTFNEGDAASASVHQPLISRNSFLTISGNAGSDHGRNFNIGTEKSDQCRDGVTNELGNAFSHEVPNEIFVFDKEAVAIEGAGQGIYDDSQSFQHGDFDQEGPIKCSPMEFQDSGHHVTDMVTATDDADDLGLQDETCSKCGCRYRPIGLADDLEQDANLCSDCRRKHGHLKTAIVVTPAVSSNLLKNVSEESKPLKDLCPRKCSSEPSSAATDTGENGSVELREMIHLKDHDNPPYSETEIQQLGNFIQGQGLTAASIASEEPSYEGDNTQRILISASSSADLSSRQQQLQSVRTSGLENCKNEISTIRSSCSGISNPTHRSIGLLSSNGDNSDISLNNVEYGGEQTPLNSEDREVNGSHECSVNIQTVNDLTSENSERISASSSTTYEHTGEEFMKTPKTCLDFEASAMSPDEHIFLSNASLGGPEVAEVPLHSSAVATSEIEMGNDLQKNNTAEFLPSDKDPMGSASEVCFSDHALGMSGESMVTVAGQGGSNGRNLTLEEAADAVLFCSSIIHRLAHEAAAIAIDKENSVQEECSRPAIAATAGKSGASQNGSPGRSGGKRAQKPRLKRVDSVTRAACGKTKSDESNMGDSLTQKSTVVVGAKPPKLESKCNCVVM